MVSPEAARVAAGPAPPAVEAPGRFFATPVFRSRDAEKPGHLRRPAISADPGLLKHANYWLEKIGEIHEIVEDIKVSRAKELHLSQIERERYDEVIAAGEDFVAALNRFEWESGGGKNSADMEKIMESPEIRDRYFAYLDAMNLTLAKALVFLPDDSYRRFHEALDDGHNLAERRLKLLLAMHKSLYPDTRILPENARTLPYPPPRQAYRTSSPILSVSP